MNRAIKAYFDDARLKVLSAQNKVVVKSIVRHGREFARNINSSNAPRPERKYAVKQSASLARLGEKKIKSLG